MVLDIIALVFGIIYTIRKLDVRQREPEQFPGVEREKFLEWKRRELFAWNLGSFACFGKLLLDYAFRYYASHAELPWSVVRVVGGGLFAAWLILLVTAALKGAGARRMRDELGISFAKKVEPRERRRARRAEDEADDDSERADDGDEDGEAGGAGEAKQRG